MVMTSYLPSAFSSSLTLRERSPIWQVPSFRPVIAEPEPCWSTVMVTSGYWVLNSSLSAAMMSAIELEPANFRSPLSFSAVEAPPPLVVPAVLELPPTSVFPQPANSTEAIAAAQTILANFFIRIPFLSGGPSGDRRAAAWLSLNPLCFPRFLGTPVILSAVC